MSTSAEDPRRALALTGFRYLLLSLACAVFGAVYELFSHQVYSYPMLYAFLLPLGGGALPFLALGLIGGRIPGRACRSSYHSGLATLTLGCLFQGALEIYGTSEDRLWVYWALGGFFTLASALLYILPQEAEDPGRMEE